jgi:hypothetical protein
MQFILRVFLLVLVALSATPAPADAEPFTILPNGDLVFNVSLSTSATFHCASVVSCTGSGTNAITLQSGSGTATFTFTGVNTTAVIGNTTVPVTLGTFEGSTTSGFATEGLNQNATLMYLTLTLAHTSPVIASSSVTWGFVPSFGRAGGLNYFQLPVGPQPPQFHYSSIIYTTRADGLTLPLNGSLDLVADAGAVPEPTCFALVATGLVGAIWRRRRRDS